VRKDIQKTSTSWSSLQDDSAKIDNRKNIDVLCFGGEDWWYCNRGHIDMQLMRRYAKYGTTLYVNSIVMQKPNIREGKMFFRRLLRKVKSVSTGLKMSDTCFWVFSPLTLPVHHLNWAEPVNETILRWQVHRVVHKLRMSKPIIWVACPAACDTAIKMKNSFLVYQRTDRYEEYPNVDPGIIRKYDQKLKTAADLTLFVSSSLYEQEHSQCRNALFLDHGVDYDVFATAEQTPYKPKDIAHIPRPIIGFFGAIDDHTSDIPFIEKIVDLLPEMSFVFVGKASSDVSRLKNKKNTWLLGQKPYEQIPHYGKCFDVAIMPWRQNRWIEMCNPVKLKEYLALGKPIVSTPFAELQKYRDEVYEAKTPQEFAQRVEKALAEDSPAKIAARRQKVRHASWESKADLIINELFLSV
jgi:glycosyltransferase involved in cell wall biosynthesis